MKPDQELALLNALKFVSHEREGLNPDPTVRVEGAEDDQQEHTVSAPVPPTTVTAKNLWRHPDAHPLVLDFALLRRYGPEWLGWEADTLRLRIPGDFNTPSVSELSIAKVQACKALHLVDSFWQRWEVFAACLLPFNGEFPDFRVMPVPTVAQCLVAADIANNIREDVEWSGEMRAYFQAVYHHDGIFLPLPPLDFVRLDVPEEIDEKALATRWKEVERTHRAPTDDTFVGVQLRRLLVAEGYLEEDRVRRQQQRHLYD